MKVGGGVSYDYEIDPSGAWIPGATPPEPPSLRKLLGDDLLVNVMCVYLTDTEVGDAKLERLKALPRLQSLDLSNTKVGDTGLQHLEGLTQLRELNLIGAKITDAGLEHLKELTQLRKLTLGGTKVGDAGLNTSKV